MVGRSKGESELKAGRDKENVRRVVNEVGVEAPRELVNGEIYARWTTELVQTALQHAGFGPPNTGIRSYTGNGKGSGYKPTLRGLKVCLRLE